MRVLVVTNMYPRPDHPIFGSFVRDQVEDLRSLGHEVEVEIIDGRDRLNYLRAILRVRRRVSTGKFDLIHAHSGLAGAVAVTELRIPTITTFHGSDYTGASKWQAQVARLVTRRTVSVFISPPRPALWRATAAVIPVGVDMDRFVPIARAEARKALGWREDRKYVLFPAQPSVALKRFDLFEAVLRSVEEVVPDVASVVLDGLPRERVPLVMSAADVTLVTSDYEGGPVVVKESIACMTPVVSVPVGDVATVIAGLPACAVERRDVGALARSVVAALDAPRDPVLRARAEEFSRPRIARQVESLYLETVRGDRTPPTWRARAHARLQRLRSA